MLDELAVSDLDQLRSRYEILRELGRDGACLLYRGRSLRSGAAVAIKLLGAPHSPGATSGALWGWQAHSMKGLSHPNLLGLYGVHHLQGGALALAMEHGRYRTLAEVIRSTGPLPPARAESILRDVAGALAHLHARGAVHRGVRPHGVFVDEASGRALLAHFGVDLTPGERGEAAERGALARALAYLAPEQIDGRTPADGPAVSAQSDLYSLGLVGCAMLMGRSPWEGTDPDGVLEERRREPLPALAELRPDVPDALLRAIEGALHPRPSRRWRSVDAFLARLDGVGVAGGPLPRVDWRGVLGGIRERADAMRGELRVPGRSLWGRGLVPAGVGILMVAAALSRIPLAPDPAGDHRLPWVRVVSPRPGVSGGRPVAAPAPQAASLAAAPAPARIAASPARGAARERPRVLRPAPREPAPSPDDTAPFRRSPIPLLGELVSEGPGGSGADAGTGTPRLLGTPVAAAPGGRTRRVPRP